MNDKELYAKEIEIEADGFITRAETLERVNADRAKPTRECVYPNCEECDKYHGHYCTVPIVVNKQMYMLFSMRLSSVENDLEKLWDCVLGDKNFTEKLP